ncbi:multicomponent Na+:H+ antiporter subunit A [Rhodococcus sp. PvR044]|uniref:Na+/H+ antiporter subunit A n=1 Tax=Rhodococcus TaxID=1827 RepID=UPI000BCAC85E|nr:MULTISPECIES: Na+/H+ antiporter subunit A [Rhodococcus]MBP1162341.1 multicomponent Na+:H+ antiporter subunit A [Rhodococcus sp. PvR099]MCZ4555029.1 Na+/H+ antiporter subunit A [Rhodococcus maanshanensis]PTR45054.1 multisubunit sodium/proton antiporter MrpA subunit /multisubunit sodium/proton antiporter MrpB subunit [Rhodococcus sp. OK611]SNX89389.1 multisubunit sodium/proton antiporter, MrpA subunit /multisubunit sodium/proton antiporter, MrpB subunit [Rhodococcus sp. OK270]
MLAVLLAHAIAAVLAPLVVRAMGRNAFLPLALVPLASLGWVIKNWGTQQSLHIQWAPGLSMDIDMRFDALAAIMSALILGIGSLVLVYCSRYFTDDEPRLGIFAAEMVAFAGAMFGLVTSDNMLILYIFWELTTVLSFLLVGHYAERASSRRAATQALLVTTAGGLAMLVGFLILGQVGGSYLISDLLADPPGGWLAGVGVVLVLIGALSKSAIVPMHFWLPGAMAAPTPVSAYLHAAAMVKAGIYLVARLAPGFADSAPWRVTVITLGLASMLLAGWRSLRAFDLKLILAFGTVSQLGFLITLVGIGDRNAALAGITMVVAHAMFKAALFMVVGVIDHTTGTRDIRKLAHLGKRAPALCVIAVLAAASMAGLPPFLGFVGKEGALEAIATTNALSPPVRTLVLATVVAGSILTVTYSIRFIWGAFGRKQLKRPSPAVQGMHAAGPLFLFVPALLAVGGLAAGLAAPVMDRLLSPYAQTLPADGNADYHLALWHGFGLPLYLTILVIGCGAVLFVAHRWVSRLRFEHPPLGNADRVYDATLRAMDTISIKLTGTTQRGSLPLTQASILVTLVLLPTILLVLNTDTGVNLRLWESPIQFAVGLIMIAAALAATVMRNRLASVILVGVGGYGCGVIFALDGAPDLALTQFLVETLTLVIFVLVLRKLPAETDERQSVGFKVPRALLGAAVGATVTALGAYAMNARNTAPISLQLPEAAYTIGNGKNVVNVLLVDIRAWDTLGEISVLLVAATGVASLVFRTRRFGTAPRVSDAPGAEEAASSSETTWLRGGDLIDPRHRSLVLEITTRMIFPTMMVLSVYFFFSGHNAPGGGFAGGLTAGLALVLRYLAGGRYELGEAVPIDAGKILGLGLMFSAGTAMASLFLGAPALSSATLEVTLPLLGHIKMVTAIFFDLGVYLIVVGLVLDVLRSLGARLDAEVEVNA